MIKIKSEDYKTNTFLITEDRSGENAPIKVQGRALDNVSTWGTVKADPTLIKVPENTLAFQFYDQTSAIINNELLEGKRKNKSPRYVIGTVRRLEDFKDMSPSSELERIQLNNILYSMEQSNNQIILNNLGTYYQLMENEVAFNGPFTGLEETIFNEDRVLRIIADRAMVKENINGNVLLTQEQQCPKIAMIYLSQQILKDKGDRNYLTPNLIPSDDDLKLRNMLRNGKFIHIEKAGLGLSLTHRNLSGDIITKVNGSNLEIGYKLLVKEMLKN